MIKIPLQFFTNDKRQTFKNQTSSKISITTPQKISNTPIATETLLEHHGQHRVAVLDKLLLLALGAQRRVLAERLNHLPETRQRLVDVDALLELFRAGGRAAQEKEVARKNG